MAGPSRTLFFNSISYLTCSFSYHCVIRSCHQVRPSVTKNNGLTIPLAEVLSRPILTNTGVSTHHGHHIMEQTCCVEPSPFFHFTSFPHTSCYTYSYTGLSRKSHPQIPCSSLYPRVPKTENKRKRQSQASPFPPPCAMSSSASSALPLHVHVAIKSIPVANHAGNIIPLCRASRSFASVPPVVICRVEWSERVVSDGVPISKRVEKKTNSMKKQTQTPVPDAVCLCLSPRSWQYFRLLP